MRQNVFEFIEIDYYLAIRHSSFGILVQKTMN